MLRRWLAAHKSLVVTATSGSVVAALVATAAIVSGGYEAKRLDLGDGSVWVANGSERVIGRANPEILALDTVVETTGTDLEIVQAGATVLLVDRSENKVDIIDPATAESVESIPLPPQSSEVFLAGQDVVIHSAGTGELWIVPVAALADFDADSEATKSLGADSAASVSPNGTIFLFSTDAREVYRVDAATGDTIQTYPADFGSPGNEVSITSVAGRWALLEPETGQLSMEGRLVDLSAEIPEPNADSVVLQEAGDRGDRVLVSHSAGLSAVALSGGGVERIAESDGGVPARPVVLDGCSYAAWASGMAFRQCGTGEGVELPLVAAGSASLGFAVNGDRVVLNDPRSGGTWAVQRNGEPIDNWDELIVEDQDQREVEENDGELPPEYEKDQLPPVAVDDEFGARPGRASVLPVLLNDYDPNGDAVLVESVDAIDESIGRIDAINNRQSLQLTLDAAASGTVSFDYTVTDGRGGSASATVTVTVRAPGENTAPTQVRASRAAVAEGGRATAFVLGDWVDPDGDAIYLTSASTSLPDTVTYKPEGVVVFEEGGAPNDDRSVALVVSDGVAETPGSLEISVRPAGEVPIIADPFVVLTYAGQEVTVRPLEHVRGGTGTIRLSSVPPKAGATIEANLDSGTFRFTSDQVRTHNLEYVVNDGEQTVTGKIRVDVGPPPDANSTPITTPKTVFVKTLSSKTVDIASSDIDPAGGVLLVSSVDDLPVSSGVRADVLEQRAVRITLTSPLDDGPVTVGYRVTNGLAHADGVITVIEIPPPLRPQPPNATDDSVTVRLGDAIDIPVLANDVHPDGEELTLSQELATGLTGDSGLLFASGNKLRYLAPQRTGNFIAVYEVAGPDGQVDQARVSIAVREAVEATNEAPDPTTVVARVLAGETVRIPIPLDGIDPDGDSVQLLGQETNPEKGSVTEIGSDYIDYLAGSYSAGTDSFDYVVVDALGERATGTVRVGIAAREGSRNPLAVEDEVRIRPGKTASIQVLANDSDPDGSVLSVVAVEPNSPEVEWEILGDIVTVTPPPVPGEYGLVYTIENAYGGTSSNFITVVVDPDAEPSYPVVKDTVLTLSDILDRDSVDVDVLRNVFFADGDVSSLLLSVLPGFGDTADVTSGNRIAVEITDERQIIPFAVTSPDDASVVSYAFIWVPGFDDALPQLDRTAAPLTVESEATLTIDINEQVIAVGDGEVRLVDATSVRATHANGDSIVVDDQTLRFTSTDLYFGPASISFEVTDGSSPDDPEGRRATLVLPIEVTPRENQPPVFTGGVIDFEPGEAKTIDLLRLTTYPYPDDLDELDFSAVSAPPTGFTYTITGSTLEIRADESAVKGTTSILTIGVRDDLSEGQAGRLRLGVVPSTRPLAQPATDSVIAPRGETTTVDVLANDEATNPFPGRALSVRAIRGLDGAAIPAGVTITPSADRTRLTVTVSATAAPVDTNLQYQVADATGDPDRFVYGTVRISVQDRPDAPAAPTRADGGYEEGLLTLSLDAPVSNNSPITNYEVISTSHGEYRKDCGTNLRCALSDLVPGLLYQFSVVATNAIGSSDPSPLSDTLSADYLPAAPQTVSAVATGGNRSGAELAVSWSAVPDPDPGSAVEGYTVRITGPGVDYVTSVGPSTTTLTTTANRALAPNTQYVATVYASNRALVLSDADWRRTSSAPVTTIGPPSQTAGGVAAAVVGSEGHIQVTWGASNPNGASAVTYSVGRFDAGTALPDSCAVGGSKPGVAAGAAPPVSSGWTDTATNDGRSYHYVVYAENSLFCTPTRSGPVESKTPPGAPVATTTVEAHGGQADLLVGSLSASGTVHRFQTQLNGSGVWADVATGQWLTSIQNASVYGVPQTVVYRACRDASVNFCGPASAPEVLTPVNARGSIVTCTVGQEVTSNPPVNENTPSVRYLYSFDDGAPNGEWTPYTDVAIAPPPAASPPGSGVTSVRLKAVVTLTSGQTYTDADFAESSCGAP